MHAGQEYLDAFARREVERLAEIARARRRPGSVWFENPKLWDGTSRSGSSESPDSPVERDGKPERDRRSVLSVTPSCSCCGRAFAGRRSTAKFFGDVCRQRSRRGRCDDVEQKVA
jgi:hypothetical protein